MRANNGSKTQCGGDFLKLLDFRNLLPCQSADSSDKLQSIPHQDGDVDETLSPTIS
jgi:hypothetical protein